MKKRAKNNERLDLDVGEQPNAIPSNSDVNFLQTKLGINRKQTKKQKKTWHDT